MHYIVDHLPEYHIILITTGGKITAGNLNQLVLDAKAAADRDNCKLLLLDHRQAQVHLDILEISNRPDELDRLGFPRSCKIAAVYREQHFELFRLFETVCVNRGFQVKIFTEFVAARNWLLGNSSIQ